MKLDNNDKALKDLLKQEAFKEGENEWFTPRVMNKLPGKPGTTASKVAWAFYAAAAMVCLAFWIWLIFFHDLSVITVRDIIYAATAAAMTLVLTFVPIFNMYRRV